MLDRTASPASKAFNESRPRRLMYLALAFIMTIFFLLFGKQVTFGFHLA